MTNTGPVGAAEIAEVFGLPRRTVNRWLANGRIPAHKLPGPTGPFVVDRATFEAMLATRERLAAKTPQAS
jgi:excisionase family DNA binding protein